MQDKKKHMTTKSWVKIFISVFVCLTVLMAVMVAVIDPFFHYHKPLGSLYYTLDNERYQNNGITRNFDYNALITGTSMTQNFKASQAQELWNKDFIKVCYSGAMYKEINDNIELALSTHDVDVVVRCLDGTYLLEDKDAERNDLGTYPDYLYDDNIFNDVNYLLNSTVIGGYCFPMIFNLVTGGDSGITSFDEYSRWMEQATLGAAGVLGDRTSYNAPEESVSTLTEEEIQTLTDTVTQNITNTAAAHPDTRFYYFFPPYSAAFWGGSWEKGTLIKEIECYRLAAELILPYENIHLFAFDDMTDITCNLDNYRDVSHYGSDINDMMLEMMAADENRLTLDNYNEYYDEMEQFYESYDFNSLIE